MIEQGHVGVRDCGRRGLGGERFFSNSVDEVFPSRSGEIPYTTLDRRVSLFCVFRGQNLILAIFSFVICLVFCSKQ